MKTINNTVLVSGGSAGIGLEIAKLFSARGNQVIITGRSEERLEKALRHLPGATAIVCDIASEADTNALVERLQISYPDLNIVINNAGAAHVYSLTSPGIDAWKRAQEEILTNYLAIIRLNEKLLPLLKRNDEAAIVHVSSIVAIVPGALATYSASKAALHSYTQSLRIALERESPSIRVFELMPPLVDTAFSAPIGGHKGIPASEVAIQFLQGFEKDEFEIRVGLTEDIYRLFLSSPGDALMAMNPKQEKTHE